jgi:hypothetical protein
LNAISEEFRLSLVISLFGFGKLSAHVRQFVAERQRAVVGVTEGYLPRIIHTAIERVNPVKRKFKLSVQKVCRHSVTASGMLLRAYCVACQQDVEMLTRDQAAKILEIEPDVLDILIFQKLVHVIEMVNGNQRICKESLFARAKYAKA